MSLAPGSSVGPYEITGRLGAGGMGEVYRARDAKLNRDVAIKVLLPAVANDPDRLARFSREAQVLASLNHTNIAQIYGIEDGPAEAGHHVRALVMELVEGPTLADRIAQGPLPLDETLPIARQIAEALEAAHEQGIIHRDLKPANIKVRDDGTVKLLDFGLAKLNDPNVSHGPNVPNGPAATMSPTLSLHATQAGLILGTAAYMSPEQAKGKVADRRADIWAFGVVLVEMLTGQRPFTGETASETMAAVMMQPPDLSALPATLPTPIRDLVRRCLIKDPRNRLQSIGEARIAIDAAITEPHTPLATTAPSASHGGGHSRVWMGVTALAVAAAITLAVVHFRETPPPAAPVVRFQVPVQGNFMTNPPFELSPDGRFLAYWGRGTGGAQALFIRTIETAQTREIAGNFQISPRAPFWSPDSRFLFYVTGAGLNRLEPSGTPRLVCACFPYDGTINQAGVAVLAFQSGGGLFSLPPSAREPVALTSPPGGARQHMVPRFAPDGRRVLYVEGIPSEAADRSYYLAELGEGTPVPRRLSGLQGQGPAQTWTAGSDSYVLVRQEDRLVAQRLDLDTGQATGDPVTVVDPMTGWWSISDNGVLAYRPQTPARAEVPTWFDRQGSRGAALGEQGVYEAVALSPDGLKLAARRNGSQIWLRDLRTGNDVRFTLGTGVAAAPIWAQDGSALVFASTRDGLSQLYRKVATGAGAESLLVKSDRDIWPNDWSRDGRSILVSKAGLHMDLHVVSVGRGVTPALTPYIGDPGNQKQAQFSPDGRHVAYASDESGAWEIWVSTFPDPSKGKWLISRGGGVEPRWSPDGRELFYFSDQKLMQTAVTTDPALAWSPPTALFEAPVVAGYSNDSHRWQVSPDGKRFLLITPASETFATPIDVIVNWPALLQRRREQQP